jgi:hypothetical protein
MLLLQDAGKPPGHLGCDQGSEGGRRPLTRSVKPRLCDPYNRLGLCDSLATNQQPAPERNQRPKSPRTKRPGPEFFFITSERQPWKAARKFR